jgi:ataxia telangiectasia mutated family protein
MLTRFVALANTMVVSSPLRRGVYWHLIEVTLDDSYYTRYLVPLLEGIARRLGLGGIQSLFRAYAAQIAVQAQNGPSDFLHLPPRVLGYRTHKECSDSTFSIVLPITIVTSLVTSDQKGQKSYGSVLKNSFFDRYCKTVRQEPIHALKECFSQLVAGFIIFNQEGSLPRTRGESYPLREWIIQCARECDKGADPEQYVRIRADSIVASILCFGGDIDYHPDGSIVEALRRSDPSAAEVFIRLNKFRRFNDFPMHMVNFPAASTDAVLNSLKWFTDTFVDKLEHGLGMATIYHATHHLFAAVLSTPLVNEQLRYIHSLSLWLAISAAILDQPPMMRMLLTHSLALLPQEDLTHSAQSIISWTLEQTRHSESSGSDIELSIVISRIAELGVQFSRSPDQPTLDIGHDLLDWIEKELQTLRESVEIRRILEPTITLWPRTLNGQSQFSTDSREFIDAQTVGVLSAGQQRLLGRFRAVRHLNSIPLYATYTFAADHFWTLKTSIPDDSLLLQEDIDAFTELLSKSSGHFQPVRSELPEEDRLTDRQRANAQQSIKLVIVQWLLDLMAVATSSSLHIIHGTLRLLCHPKCGEPGTTDHPVLSLFRVGALDPIHATPCEPSDLKRSSFRNLASDYSRWISDITVFLARLLAKVDIFYGQLPPLLISETSFAANLLPILVHQLLICDRKEPFLGSLRPLLSTYIRSIIHSDSAETAVREAVLNIILHLRHFSRPDGNDPLGHDKWLDLDFLELCRTSLSCGAYTTSLLFLELAEEYRIGDGKKKKPQIDNNWDQEKEDVLYEIYRHIDEPDGFYAIKGRDIQKHLMHKFHHEKKWAKAFQSHVSQYEGVRNGDNTVNDERQGLPGVIQSLHSFGFNQLAMSLARGATTVSSADLAYSLAWRTETWDLPQAANPSLPSSFLYGVMRSVHRGRNVSITQNLCDKAVRWEMQQLRSTNVENVVEIRRVIQSLLCLREVKQWLNEWRLLNSQSLSHSDSFLKFSQLSSELE